MVSTKSSKTAKYTYAERVLGAFTQAKKNQRRHSVHIATLRAQVKKSAESKKDKLGPQWAQWVGKAVQRLENEGILEPSEPAGTVAMTPNGKKIISSVRRSLNIPTNVEPSTAQEELILKQVTHAGSRGIKRPRTSRASNARHELEDEEDVDVRTPNRANKRSRPSVSAKSSPSKMTKAQLQAELESLKIAHQQVLLRATSPLTDLSDDDDDPMTPSGEVRGEEHRSRRHRQSSGAGRPRESGSTAQGTAFNNPSMLATPPTSSRRTPGGISQSGSHTPNVDERPGPTQSAHGGNEDYEMEHPLDTLGSTMAILSPEASPIRPIELHNTQIERLERKYLELKSQHDKVALEVSERDARILSLQTEIDGLTDKVTEDAAGIAQFADLEITLTSQAENLERCISDHVATIAGLEQEREELKEELSGLQQTLRVAEEKVVVLSQLESTIRDLQSQKKSVEEQLGSEQFKNSELFEGLRDEKATNESLLQQLADMSTKIALLEDGQAERNTATQLLEESLSQSRHDAQVLRERITNLEASSHSKELELVQSHNRVGELEKALDNLGKLEQEMKTMAEDRLALLEAETLEKERLIQTVATKERDIAKMTEDAVVVESLTEKLTVELSMKEAVIQELQGELAEVGGKLFITEESLVASNNEHLAEISSLTSRLSSVEGSLDSANLEARSLRTQLESAETAQALTRAQVVERDIDLSKIRGDLESEQKRGNSLETELVRTKGNALGLEEMIHDIKASKEGDEKTIQCLKNMFVTLRETQMRSLREMEEKVNSANSTAIASGSWRKALH